MHDIFLKEYKGFTVNKKEEENVDDLMGALNEILEKNYNCQISYDTINKKKTIKFFLFQVNAL